MKRIPILFFLLTLVLAACTPPPLVPPETPQPSSTPSPEPGPPQEPTPTLPMSEVPEVILRQAYADLAARLGIPWADISLLSGEQVDFPDGCLGVHTPGVLCTDVITPGYRIQLQAGSSVYTYVTNLEGSAVILAGSAGPSGEATPQAEPPVLSWSRDGGIAGFCDKLEISAAGSVTVTSCKQPERRFRLTAEQQTQLDTWLEKYGSVDYAFDNRPNVADGMSTTLHLAGRGSLQPTEEELNELLKFASAISLQP